MAVQLARPDVTGLQLRVAPRWIHPEFFDCAHDSVLTATLGGLLLQVRLSTAGHVLTWRDRTRVVTEAITEKQHALIVPDCVIDERLRGCRTRSLTIAPGWRYAVSAQLERLDEEIFLRVHDELRSDCADANLAREFPSGNRFAPGALSLVQVDLQTCSAAVHTFHTFPAHCAIVKTQSLLEWD